MNFSNKFQLQINSSNSSTIKNLYLFCIYTLKKNKIFNLKINRIQLPLKIKKFTLLKSPHIFKKARTQIEVRMLKNVISITNFNTTNNISKLKKIITNIIKNLPITIRLKLKTFKLIYV